MQSIIFISHPLSPHHPCPLLTFRKIDLSLLIAGINVIHWQRETDPVTVLLPPFP